jgi:hypothetical protein
LAALGLLALAPAAQAQDPNNPVLNDFQDDGRINNPCAYAPGELREGINNLPPDVQQYGDTSVGGCGGPAPAQQPGGVDTQGNPLPGVPGQPGGGPPAGEAAAVEIPEPPGPNEKARDAFANASLPAIDVAPRGSDAPWWLTLLGLLVLAGVVAFALLRRRGWSAERWTKPLGASVSDAGGRTADTAAEVWDWVRLGR